MGITLKGEKRSPLVAGVGKAGIMENGIEEGDPLRKGHFGDVGLDGSVRILVATNLDVTGRGRNRSFRPVEVAEERVNIDLLKSRFRGSDAEDVTT